MIPETENAYNNKKSNKQTKPPSKPWGRGRIWFSALLWDLTKQNKLNLQINSNKNKNKKNHKKYKETGQYGPFKGKNKPTVTKLEKRPNDKPTTQRL